MCADQTARGATGGRASDDERIWRLLGDSFGMAGRGAIPAALQRVANASAHPAQQFSANMLLASAATFQRNHPLTDAIGASLGMSAGQVGELFIAAAAL
jgi:hypothetical protein